MKRPRSHDRRSRRARLEGLEARRLLAADGILLRPDAAEVAQNSEPIFLWVLANDSFDEDYVGNGEITAVSTGSLGGQIERMGDVLRYSPPAGTTGTEVFRYTVDDRASAEVTVRIAAPLQNLELATDRLEQELRLDLIEMARFPDGYAGARRITLVSESSLSADVQITEDGRSIVYRSPPHRSGKDSFSYIVDETYVATVFIDVKDPLAADRFEVLQNSDATTLDVLANDFRSGTNANSYSGVISEAAWESIREDARITHVLDANPQEFSIAADGKSLQFKPTLNETGYRSIRYVVDGRFESSVIVWVQRPTVDDHFQADIEGGAHALDVLANDHYRSVLKNQQIRVVERVTSVTQGDHGGVVEVLDSGARVSYTPAEGFSGLETFEYVADGKYPAKVSVTVTSPVRNDVASVILGGTISILVLENDFLGTDRPDAVITSVGQSSHGSTILIGPEGVIHYTPAETQDRYFDDTFEYTVNDRYTATVTVYVSSPVIGDSYLFDRRAERVLTVLENDRFDWSYSGNQRITGVSQPSAGGSVTISSDGRSLIYLASDPTEHFTYTVDDRFTATVSINPIRRLQRDVAVAEQNGDPIIVNVLENDFRDYYNSQYGPYTGQRLVSVEDHSEQGGVLQVTPQRGVEYTPPPDFTGIDSFTYTVDNFLTETVTVRVIRRSQDDLISVSPDSSENVLNVLANDVRGADYTGNGLLTDVSSSDAGSILRISEDRRFVHYTPPQGFRGQDHFTYTIDGRYKATVTVSVQDESRDRLRRFESQEELREELLESRDQTATTSLWYGTVVRDLVFHRYRGFRNRS